MISACPPNMYKRDEGSLSCTPCPQGTYIPEGSLGLSADSCQCRPGFQRGFQGECEGRCSNKHQSQRSRT